MSMEINSPSTKRKNENISQNLNQNKKYHKFGIKEVSNQIIEASANESIIFKIIHSELELNEFHNFNLENSFHPIFTLQIFPNEIINGYINPKILISLTPKYFYPHVKFTYDKETEYHDDVNKILKELFDEAYTDDNKIFLQKLKEESEISSPPGEIIVKDNNIEVYHIDILKEQFLNPNWNFQNLCKFFIDGASYIYLNSNFWNYFLTIKRDETRSNWITIGFCSFKNFHMEYNKYCSMISQFLILPIYQRKGYGSYMLKTGYDFLREKDSQCYEITTEDPCLDFILMRDCTIIKMIIEHHKIDKLLEVLGKEKEIKTKEIYVKFTLLNDNIKEIATSFKLQKDLIKRAFEIIKFSLCSKSTINLFENEKLNEMKNSMRSELDIGEIFKKKRRGPFIYFDDEPDFDYLEIIKEEQNNINIEMTVEQKAKMVYMDYEVGIKKISSKIGKIVLDYKTEHFQN